MSNHPNFTTPGVNRENHHALNTPAEPDSGEFAASVRQLVDYSTEHSTGGAVVRANGRAMVRLTNMCRQAILAHGTMELAEETAEETMLFIPAFVAENPAAFDLPSKVVALFLRLADDRRRNIEEIAKLHPDWETALAIHSDAVIAEAIAEGEAWHQRRRERAAAKAAAESATLANMAVAS